MADIWKFLLYLADVLRREGWNGLLRLIALGLRMLERRRQRAQLSEQERHRARGPCIPIDRPEYIRPDPLIYDQYYLMSLGLAVTWANPDIKVYLQGVEILSSQLKKATTYQVVARVWNNSTTCPVVNMLVRFSYLDFGIGTVSNSIGLSHVDLGVKGGPNHPAYASVDWTTPAQEGHYCLQAVLFPPDDVNWNNNLGQHNFDVGEAASPAVFTFMLRNATDRRHRFALIADAYAIVELPFCDAKDAPSDRRAGAIKRHDHASHPVPAGWQIKCTPSAPELDPGQAISIEAVIEPPPAFSGEQAINIRATWDGHHLAGGITLLVSKV